MILGLLIDCVLVQKQQGAAATLESAGCFGSHFSNSSMQSLVCVKVLYETSNVVLIEGSHNSFVLSNW
jgi:hypothetical protein